jgi:hypothetical protein
VARRYRPAAVPLGGRVLAPRRPTPPWRWNQAPAAVPRGGRDLTPRGATAGACRHGVRRQMYISRKFWFDHLFSENHDKLNVKKFSTEWDCRSEAMGCAVSCHRGPWDKLASHYMGGWIICKQIVSHICMQIVWKLKKSINHKSSIKI